jgi:ribose transport system permease protein
VTLCGLLVYRGITRWITGSATQGYQNQFDTLRKLATGEIPLFGDYVLPVPFLLMSLLAVAAATFLHRTIFGRYLLALGRNEQATRYSGVNTDRMTILAYVICALLAGAGGVLFSLEINSVQPSSYGNFYELYAIAAAVLGGCSLRGGEASILGVVIGTAVMQVLANAIVLLGIDDQLEMTIIGGVLLAGVMADELVKRYASRRRAVQAARAGAGTA